MAPVPEQASGITSWRVWNSILRPALTSPKSAWYSGVRWWMIGRAMASRTSLGTGVGPGAMSWYFFIEFRPLSPRRGSDDAAGLYTRGWSSADRITPVTRVGAREGRAR